MNFSLSELLPEVKTIAINAGEQIMAIYRSDDWSVQYKSDQSPVTKADLVSHQFITNALGILTPDLPIISEENKTPSFETRRHWQQYWLVDPLDGTKEFIARNDEFIINIALISGGKPVLGVMYAPVSQICYFATGETQAYKQTTGGEPILLKTRQRSISDSLIILTSRHSSSKRVAALAAQLPNARITRYGSTEKLCFIADGKADIYTRFGPVFEWDLAAGHCILEQAGGRVYSITGDKLVYNTPHVQQENFFAIGCADLPWQRFLPS